LAIPSCSARLIIFIAEDAWAGILKNKKMEKMVIMQKELNTMNGKFVVGDLSPTSAAVYILTTKLYKASAFSNLF